MLFSQLSLALAEPLIDASDAALIVGVLVVLLLIISLGVHEAAHAWVANLCGDSTAKDMGRITLNPIPHIDPVMTIILPGALYFLTNGTFVFGGAKPVPVAYHRLRKPARDMMLVALAGPISNLLIALVLFAILKVLVYEVELPLEWSRYRDGTPAGLMGIFGDTLASSRGKANMLTEILCKSIFYNALLADFNMIPLPPLDGSRVVAFLLPEPLRGSFQALDRFSFLLIMGLFYTGVLHAPLMAGIHYSIEGLHAITGGVWL